MQNGIIWKDYLSKYKLVSTLDSANKRQWFAFSISNSSAYWRNENKNYKDFCDIHDSKVFGYLSELEDQRMNFIYFELNPPLRFRIYNINNQLVGVGKLFIHIYPTGHISLNIAISYIRCKEITTKYHLDSIIKQLKPWEKNSELVLHSKFGKTSLNELIEIVLNRISLTFFSIEKAITQEFDWNCSTLIISDNIIKVLKDIVDYVDYENCFKRKVYLQDDFLFGEKNVNEYICAKGKILFYLTEIERKGILHSFWKTQRLKEFIEYKKMIYGSYISYFKNETIRIKKTQYGVISLENIFGKNFYQSDIAQHILVLDQMVNSLNPVEKALYSYICDIYEFDNHRERLLSSLNEWESQIKEWNDKEPMLLPLVELIIKLFGLFSGGAK